MILTILLLLDHSGSLNLREILSIPQLPGHDYVYNSLWLLFKFNKNLQGSLTYNEFEKLLLYLKSISKDIKEKRLSRPKSKMWIPITRKTAKREFKLTRDSSTPIITGQMPEDDSSDSDSDSSAEEEDLSEHIYIETSDFFEKMTESEEGRQTFYKWLFKLTDMDKTGQLKAEHIATLIKILRQDGINPQDLLYGNEIKEEINHLSIEDQDLVIAKQIISDYDANGDDFLTEKEFEILAKIILKNYELIYEQVDTGKSEGIYKIVGYTIKRKVGQGSAGVVTLAVEHKTGERKAIKIVPKGNVSDLSRLDTEIKAMMMLKHERILKLEQVIENEQEVFFVMEFCGGGSLLEYMDGKPLSEKLVRFYFSQIISGVCYCHSKGVAHRDLKLDNILLDNMANIKITDFGHAGIYQKGWDLFATPLVGGLCHVTPEQILGNSYSGEKHDIWSLGIILYTLLVGYHPFKSKNPQKYLEDIKNVNYELPDFLSEEAADLIKKLLVADSDNRPTCKEIMKHPWLNCGKLDAPLLSTCSIPVPSGTWKKVSPCEGMCRILKRIGIEPIYTEESLQFIEDESRCIRCHWPEKDLKFHFNVKEGGGDSDIIFEFQLGSGASKDFLLLMPIIKFRIARRRIKRKKSKKGKRKFDKEFDDYLDEVPHPLVVPLEQRKDLISSSL